MLHAPKTALILGLALALAGLFSYWLADWALVAEVLPFNLSSTGSHWVLFSLNFLLFFDILVLVA